LSQNSTGTFIAKKRKEKNLTQAQFAEKVGVSNKTVSKWENDVCMPDYSVIERLCDELQISVQELISGTESDEKSDSVSPDVLSAFIKKYQNTEKQLNKLSGALFIILGLTLLALSRTFDGVLNVIILSVSVVEMLIGLFIIGKNSKK